MALLADTTIETWFDERVRPLVRYEPENCCGGRWGSVVSGLDDHALDAVEERMRRYEGAPARTALTILVGWRAGYLASVIALGLLRDEILVAPATLRVLRSPDGWCADVRLDHGARALVAAEHPWSSRADVTTVRDRAALEAEAVAAIGRACAPVVDVLARRARRARAGMWAQVADGLGNAALALVQAEPQMAPCRVARETERLLRAPGAPWKHVPQLWTAEAGGEPVLVKQRRSCCLSYRCDRTACEQPDSEAPEPAFLARFGHELPHYCDTCPFRSPADVEARALFRAERARVTS
jgi:hypothetical protein